MRRCRARRDGSLARRRREKQRCPVCLFLTILDRSLYDWNEKAAANALACRCLVHSVPSNLRSHNIRRPSFASSRLCVKRSGRHTGGLAPFRFHLDRESSIDAPSCETFQTEPRKTRNTRKAERISDRRAQRQQRDRCLCCPARTKRLPFPMSED